MASDAAKPPVTQSTDDSQPANKDPAKDKPVAEIELKLAELATADDHFAYDQFLETQKLDRDGANFLIDSSTTDSEKHSLSL